MAKKHTIGKTSTTLLAAFIILLMHSIEAEVTFGLLLMA